jgi:DNA-binding transcriptional ArsR family regulator
MSEITACCAPVLSAPLEEDEAEELAAAFKVLADPARLRLLSLVATRPRVRCARVISWRPSGAASRP